MLQDVINFIKETAKTDLKIDLKDNTPQQKDMSQVKSPMWVITTSTDEPTTDMCYNIYHTSTIKVMGVTPMFTVDNDTDFAASINEIQEKLDKLGKILVNKTKKAMISLTDDTDILQFNNYTVLPIGIDKEGRHVYELTLVTQWLSTVQ